MNVPYGLLMRTPAYHGLESPLHYVLRLSEANGYHTPTVVMTLAAPREDWRVLAKWNYSYINRLLPACRHTPSTFTYRWRSSNRRCDLSLLGRRMLSRHLNASGAGVCPECIHELGFAPAWWDIRYAIACPIHQRMFVHKCPTCGQRLSHLRRGLLTCSCGASLATPAVEQPPAALLWLMTLLKQKTEVQHSGSRKASEIQTPLNPEEANLATICRIIETIGKAEHQLSGGKSRSRRSLDVQRECLPGVASFLYEWPSGVAGFCSRWRTHVAPHNHEKPSLRSVFPWAFQRLLHKRGEQRSNILFVIDSVLQYASSELPGFVVDIRARDLQRLRPQEREYCGVTRAADESRIPRHTMIRLIRRGRVPYRVAHRGTRVIYEIKTEIARNVRLEYRPALGHRQGSRHLGITHNMYQDLRRSGVLKKVHETMMRGAIAVCDLDDFKRRILGRAQYAPSSRELVSLDRLRLMKCPRIAMVGIINGLQEGSIRCFHGGEKPQRINDLLVCRTDVDPIIASLSRRAPPTVDEFRARYQLSLHESAALIRHLSGTPASVARVPPGIVDEKKLDDFMARYCGLMAYACAHGMAYLAALAHLQRAKAELLKIPVAKQDGRFVYFVPRRSDKPALP